MNSENYLKPIILLGSLSINLTISTLHLCFYLSWLRRYDQITTYHPEHGGHLEIQDGGHQTDMPDCQRLFSISPWIYEHFDIGWHMLPKTVNENHIFAKTQPHYDNIPVISVRRNNVVYL